MSDFLVKILQERGISRYRLSKMTGIPQSTIAEWVKNNKTPSADRLAIVADALDVSLGGNYCIFNRRRHNLLLHIHSMGSIAKSGDEPRSFISAAFPM